MSPRQYALVWLLRLAAFISASALGAMLPSCAERMGEPPCRWVGTYSMPCGDYKVWEPSYQIDEIPWLLDSTVTLTPDTLEISTPSGRVSYMVSLEDVPPPLDPNVNVRSCQ